MTVTFKSVRQSRRQKNAQMAGQDWSFRPTPWHDAMSVPIGKSAGQKSYLATDVSLHHDCQKGIVTWHQIKSAENSRFSLHLQTTGFSGNFVSLAIALPEAMLAFLQRNSVVTVAAPTRIGRVADAVVRLNLKQGANVFSVWQEKTALEPGHAIGIELLKSEIEPSTAQDIWLDMIYSTSADMQVEILDVLVSHRLRAEY